jgi:hypothetical protein
VKTLSIPKGHTNNSSPVGGRNIRQTVRVLWNHAAFIKGRAEATNGFIKYCSRLVAAIIGYPLVRRTPPSSEKS